MGEARLDPEPVADGDGAGDAERGQGRQRPGRREEEEVEGQQDGRVEVEGEVGQELEVGEVRVLEELGVDGLDGPVEDGDAAFERRGGEGEDVFEAVERGREEQVREERGVVGQRGDDEAAAGQELEVPAPGFVDGVGEVD